ncbi:hypothetical protein, partial [Plasmodium yoelii yoelii]
LGYQDLYNRQLWYSIIRLHIQSIYCI